MRTLKLVIILFILSLFLGCISSKLEEDKIQEKNDIYKEKLNILIKDSKLYNNKRNSNLNYNSILPNGIYIFSKDENGNNILYVYDFEKLSKMTFQE